MLSHWAELLSGTEPRLIRLIESTQPPKKAKTITIPIFSVLALTQVFREKINSRAVGSI